ncbi:MAG: hypothetical protein KJO07_11030, partial [Deltaproteobacteria bacterium]|nr:hypothetical protein [Deltaproteobacteria bacterium]
MVGFALLVACGGSDGGGAEEPLPPKTEPAEPAPKATSMLGVGDMKIVIEGKEALRIGADGSVAVNMDGSGNWQNVGTIANDSWTKDGKQVATVGADGVVTFGVAGGGKGLTFDGASLTAGDNKLGVDDKGFVTGLNPGAEGKIKIEGATDDAKKRTALLVTISIFMAGEQSDEASSGTPPAAEPVPAPSK